MADNIENVEIPLNTWVDLYAATGLAVGSQIVIENIGNNDVYLAVQETQPDKDHSAYNVVKRPPAPNTVQNTDGDLGAWAYCPNAKGKLAISPQIKAGFLPVVEMRLTDGFGNPIGSLKGAIDVHAADVHNVPVNDFVHRHAEQTTLAVAATAGDTSITLVDATGFDPGDYIHMGPTSTSLEPIHPQITATVGNVVTLDRPLDFSYPIGDDVSVSVVNLVTGTGAASLVAPVVYRYRPHHDNIEHISRLLLSMIHTSAGSDDRFGGITALTNGVVIRAQINGQVGTFTNWKTNGDIRLDMYDVDYSDKVGGGNFGTAGRGSFSRIGVAIRLDPAQGDFIELLVQDPLLALVDFRLKMQGHVEGL